MSVRSTGNDEKHIKYVTKALDKIYIINTCLGAELSFSTGAELSCFPDRSASYLDLHLKIDSEGRLRMKLYDKRHDFNFPIVNFPFICSNIPVAPAAKHFMRISQSLSLWKYLMRIYNREILN